MWVVAQRNRKTSGHTESCRRRIETELRTYCRDQRSREANENFLQPREVPSPVEGEHEHTVTTEWMDEDSETAPKQSWSRWEWECGRWRESETDILRISNECTKRRRMQSGHRRRKTLRKTRNHDGTAPLRCLETIRNWKRWTTGLRMRNRWTQR